MPNCWLLESAATGAIHGRGYDDWTGLGKKYLPCSVLQPGRQAGEEEKTQACSSCALFYSTPALPSRDGGLSGAHYWARRLKALGHTVKLLPPQHVKPYVRGQKNDYNDAAGIAEAVTRPGIHAVAIKSIEQQDTQALHRLRKGRIKERTALCNQLRGLLGEYGIVIPKSLRALRKRLPGLLEDAENGLSHHFRSWLNDAWQQLIELDQRIERYTQSVKELSQADDSCRRLQSVPGMGPIIASAFAAHVGDGKAFRRGRDVSASLGLVPRQHSSGDKVLLLGITKRGDCYLRSLLIHGARAVVRTAKKKDDPLSRWINSIREKHGFNKAAVALANKMARIGWAILRNQTTYQATAA